MTVPSIFPEDGSVRTSAMSGMDVATCNAAEDPCAINRPGMELVIWRRALAL